MLPDIIPESHLQDGASIEGTVVAGSTSSAGSGLTQLNSPTDVTTWGSDGEFLVSDTGNHRVLLCPPSTTPGSLASTAPCTVVAGSGGQGPGLTQLDAPRGIDVTEANNVIIADSANHRIIECDVDAALTAAPNAPVSSCFVVVGDGVGQGDAMSGLYVNPAGVPEANATTGTTGIRYSTQLNNPTDIVVGLECSPLHTLIRRS